ncbi:MAG: flavin reductase family protein [Hyphomicrobiaceae bacterium]|nr:flavin reductase family protein [Hyphomicrobiaceae bacterium]
MFYDTLENKHGLKHDPFKALMVPRPIGWISSVSASGVANIAPYSFFNAFGERPTYVGFGSAGLKDSLKNILETREFTCSLATWDLRYEMNATSASVPYGVDEYPIAGLTAVAGTMVKAPRVKESPAAFECRLWQTIELPGRPGKPSSHTLVIGEVIGVHIDDRFVKDGIVDTGAMRPIARLGYMEYGVLNPENVFTINRPEVDADGKVVNLNPDKPFDGQYR